MKKDNKYRSWAAIFVFIFLVFAFAAPGQVKTQRLMPPLLVSPTYPFDFSDRYYSDHGINSKEIIGRRDGSDGLSVFDKLVHPDYTSVRVLVTVPGYDQNGEPLFWYPLGDLTYTGFTNDRIGASARKMAQNFPIYIFPDRNIANFSAFANARQAPVLDDSWGMSYKLQINPLGLREILVVNYTEKAFGKEGVEMMAFFGKKNGFSTDDTPIIKSVEDIAFLFKNGFISVEPLAGSSMSDVIGPNAAQFAIGPRITKKGSIALDAFLWMSTKDGSPLPTEELFVEHFNCMKKSGDWCGS